MLKQQEHIGKPLFSSNLFFFKFIFYNSSFFVVADRTMTYQVGNFYKRFFYVCKNTPMCEYIKKSLSLCFRFKQERREIWFLPLERSFSTETTSARHLRMEKKKVFFLLLVAWERKKMKNVFHLHTNTLSANTTTYIFYLYMSIKKLITKSFSLELSAIFDNLLTLSLSI